MTSIRQLALAGLVATLVGLTLIVVEFAPRPTTSADWAAWVQAVGAVIALSTTSGAVVAQIVVGNRQIEAARAAETRERSRILQAGYAAGQRAVNGMYQTLRLAKTRTATVGQLGPALRRATEIFKRDLNAFPTYMLGDFEIIQSLDGIRASITAFQGALGVAMPRVEGSPDLDKAEETVLIAARTLKRMEARLAGIGVAIAPIPATGKTTQG